MRIDFRDVVAVVAVVFACRDPLFSSAPATRAIQYHQYIPLVGKM